MTRKYWLRFLILAWLAIGSAFGFSFGHDTGDSVTLADLPREARQTFELIKAGGPFPYDRDGIVFGNYEKQLPARPRGYYHEYTVKSPWRRDRGPRRIITGRDSEFYYTDDHYRSFRRIRE
jgi:ribonuclease T1